MNVLLQESSQPSTPSGALVRLNRYIDKLHQRKHPIELLEGFEREVHQRVVEVEQEILAEGLSQLDIEAPVVEVHGQIYRHVYRTFNAIR